MKIYFRKSQLSTLHQFADQSGDQSNLILLTGKRKVGKTTLVKQFLKSNKGAYITISSKSSYLQLQDISEYLKTFYFKDEFIPQFQSWGAFFEFLFHLAKHKPINIVIDEFQNFELIEPVAYSELKKAWDLYAESSKLNLLVVTSNVDFVSRTFKEPKSPLYSLNNYSIKLTPFTLSEVIAIFKHNKSKLSTRQIVTLYAIFGGLPKYYFLLERFNLWNKKLDVIFRELIFMDFAPLGYELKELLINDFSRGNKIYLSILQSIAAGYNKMSEIARAVDIPVTNLTKYLFELEKKKRLIKREVPLSTKDDSKSKFGRYYIKNYFDNFWFRFIQPDIINYEMGQYERMLKQIDEEIDSYFDDRVGIIIRNIFTMYPNTKVIEYLFPYKIDAVGALWNRKDLIDIVITSKESKKILYCHLITSEKPVTKALLESKISVNNEFKDVFPKYNREFAFITKNGLTEEADHFCNENAIKTTLIDMIFDVLLEDMKSDQDPIVEVDM